MLFSTQTEAAMKYLGVEGGIDLLIDAGYTALDMTLFAQRDIMFLDNYKEYAKELRKRVEDRGVIWNQAHAPFGGGYEHYTKVLVPELPRTFEFSGLLGAKQVIVHPVQPGRFYGHEKEIFERNVEFYKELAPYAKDAGVKIAIENMWQNHRVTGAICDDICADPYEHAALYDTLDDPEAFTICLDLGHVAVCGREPENAIKVIGGDRLGALHVHDVDYIHDNHTLPGCGKINWDNVCHSLAEIDYKGELTLEADNFVYAFGKEMISQSTKFMAARAKFLADKVEEYRK